MKLLPGYSTEVNRSKLTPMVVGGNLRIKFVSMDATLLPVSFHGYLHGSKFTDVEVVSLKWEEDSLEVDGNFHGLNSKPSSVENRASTRIHPPTLLL